MKKSPNRSSQKSNKWNVIIAAVLALSFILIPLSGVKALAGITLTPSGGALNLREGGNLAPSYGYTFQVGGTVLDTLEAVDLDNNGNMYIGGGFNGTADIDPTVGVKDVVSNGGFSTPLMNRAGASGSDIFISKVNSDGTLAYAYNMGGIKSEHLMGIKSDSSGNAYALGLFAGTVDFDPTAGVDNKTSSPANVTNIFLTKINSNGSYGYTYVFDAGVAGSIFPNSLVIGPDDSVYFSGYFSGTIDFNTTGSGPADSKTSDTASLDAFFTKINANGSYGYTYTIGGAGTDSGSRIFVDSSNNVYLAGIFAGSVDLDPTAGTDIKDSAVVGETFFTKINSSGNYVFSKTIKATAPGYDQLMGIAVDGLGNIYLAGYFTGTTDFNPESGPNSLTATGDFDAFLAKYNFSGVYQSVLQIGDVGRDVEANAIAVDSSDNVYISGTASNGAEGIDFDPTAGVDFKVIAGYDTVNYHAFLTKINANGTYGFTKTAGGNSGDSDYYSIAVNNSGKIFAGGYFAGVSDFNDPTSAPDDNKTSAGSFDGFATLFVPDNMYTVVLNDIPTSNVTIALAPNNDLTVSSSSVTFTPATWDIPRFIYISAVNDTFNESAGQTGFVDHTASSADLAFDGLTAQITATISDNGDDVVPITTTVTQSGGSTWVSEAGVTDTYTIVLGDQPVSNVTITPSFDAAQINVVPANIVFTPYNWNTPQTFTVSAVDDAIVEGTHTSLITHAATSADPIFNGIAVANVTANIIDNDGATVVLSTQTVNVIEGGAGDTLDISLSGPVPTNNVLVNIAITGTEISIDNNSLVFTPANYTTPQTINVNAVNDNVVEGAHNDSLTFSTVSLDAAYNGLDVIPVTANIADNDVAGITLFESGGITNVSESGTTDSYTLVLDTQPSANVVITETPDAEITVNPTVLTFTSANWNTPQTVTVTAVDDAIVQGNHTGTISHAVVGADLNYNGFAIASVTAHITDNDSSGGGGGGGGGGNPNPVIPNTTNGQVTVTASLGGATTLTNSDGSSLNINVPSGAVSSNTSITITTSDVASGPIDGYTTLGNKLYNVLATVNGVNVTAFSQPVSLSFTYNSSSLPSGVAKSDISLYQFDAAQNAWLLAAGFSNDTSINKIILSTKTIGNKYALVYRTPTAGNNNTGNNTGGFNYSIDSNPGNYSYGFITQSNYPIIKSGENTSLILTIKNTGSATWYKDGPNPVRLGTSNGFDRPSSFSNSSWISVNRAAKLSQDIVRPGEIGTFNVNITGFNDKTGKFREYFTPVVEGITWMKDIGIYWDITVEKGSVSTFYNTEYISQSPFITLDKNGTANLWVEYKNTGTAVWNQNGANPVHLGTSNPLDRDSIIKNTDWLSNNRPTKIDKETVNPGETAKFNFTIKAPNVSGTIREYFRPVVEGLTWLKDVGLYWDITVK
ncbi:MAG: SBBP repeat-containing protein [Patescibacteria group bacterium]|nr:SBBP repeat-containing protein [Patescibacteria group bacterium]